MKIFLCTLALMATSTLAQAFELTSTDLKDGDQLKVDQVGKGDNCAGGNMSPALAWANPPTGTKSFAITLFDPDARNGQGFWHWGVFDIPASVTGLPTNAGRADGATMAKGAVQGKSGAGTPGFIGACPPAGPAHHYIFTVRALKVDKLGLDASATPDQVAAKADAVSLGEAKLTGLHAKP